MPRLAAILTQHRRPAVSSVEARGDFLQDTYVGSRYPRRLVLLCYPHHNVVGSNQSSLIVRLSPLWSCCPASSKVKVLPSERTETETPTQAERSSLPIANGYNKEISQSLLAKPSFSADVHTRRTA